MNDSAFSRSDEAAWRNEVASRVHAYRARRRRRASGFDPLLALPLDFEAQPVSAVGVESGCVAICEDISGGAEAELQADAEHPAAPIHEQPTAGFIDDMIEATGPGYEFEEFPPAEAEPTEVPASALEPYVRRYYVEPVPPPPRTPERKLIEFPRLSQLPPQPYTEELADPVITAPRILEATPELEASPLFAGITLDDAVEPAEMAADAPALELPLRVAPMGWRILASFVNLVLLAAATALFAFIVFTVIGEVLHSRSAIAMALLVPAALFGIYQYVFLAHAGWTPGMRIARIEAVTFDGVALNVRQRQYRAAALMLSASAAGLGIVWAALDEDQLGWHDRITRTYLTRR